MKKVKKDEKNNMKKCVICEQPLHKSGWYCIKCIREVKKINDFYQDKYKIKYPISKSTVAKIAQMHPNETNIFEYLYVNPSSIFQYFRLSGEEKSELREKYKKKKNINTNLNMNNIPNYIMNYFLDNEDKTLIDISGNDETPIIKCKCNRCGKILSTTYKQMRASSLHQCDAVISKGEYLVKKYLEENHVNFKTQFNTLQCINPKTNNILPYDFELVDKKVIIEVQGDQHLHYIPYFHQTKDFFEYQKYKDKIKKDFAIKMKYIFIEIFYVDIENGNYKKVLSDYI